MSGVDNKRERVYLCALKVHVIVANLEVHSKEVDQRDIVSVGAAVNDI